MRSAGRSLVIMALALALAACGGDDDEPAASDAVTTEATRTDPPATEPPATEPSATDPSATEPSATDPSATDPPATEPPATEPPATDPVDSGVVAPPADRPEPCSLWTAADLLALTGLAFGEGVYNDTLSVGGQDICDWIFDTAGFANAQVLIVTPSIDYASLRAGAEEAVGPITDIAIAGASSAYQSAGGEIIGMEVAGLVIQVAYLPTGPNPEAAGQLVTLAEIAAGRV